jgi:hypothetical protein
MNRRDGGGLSSADAVVAPYDLWQRSVSSGATELDGSALLVEATSMLPCAHAIPAGAAVAVLVVDDRGSAGANGAAPLPVPATVVRALDDRGLPSRPVAGDVVKVRVGHQHHHHHQQQYAAASGGVGGGGGGLGGVGGGGGHHGGLYHAALVVADHGNGSLEVRFIEDEERGEEEDDDGGGGGGGGANDQYGARNSYGFGAGGGGGWRGRSSLDGRGGHGGGGGSSSSSSAVGQLVTIHYSDIKPSSWPGSEYYEVRYDAPQERFEAAALAASLGLVGGGGGGGGGPVAAAATAAAAAASLRPVLVRTEVVPAASCHLSLGSRVLVVLPHHGGLGDERAADTTQLGRVCGYDAAAVTYEVLLDMRFGTRHFTTSGGGRTGGGGVGSAGSAGAAAKAAQLAKAGAGGGGGGTTAAAATEDDDDDDAAASLLSEAAEALLQRRQVVRAAPGQVLRGVSAWRVHLVTEEVRAY